MPDSPLSSLDRQASALLDRLTTKQSRIGVIGLGYVGLPLARTLARSGYAVIGFDIDLRKIQYLASGKSYLKHVADASLAPLVTSGFLTPSEDYGRLRDVDAVIVCVPTPLAPDNSPDMQFVIGTAEIIARELQPGQLVVLESTTYPGTTAELLLPILERSGLRSGEGFYLAYSPEREDPGNADHETADIPKVISGEGETALRLCKVLYEGAGIKTVPVSTTRTAEAVKLTENVFRAVNIALVNELKIVFDAMGIDVWEVIDAAKTKPFGFMPFYPGPGLGGHCIPIDPFYLSWKSSQYGVPAKFIKLAGEINTAMPVYIIKRLRDALEIYADTSLERARVLMIGMAYKKNVDDTRESPALAIFDSLDRLIDRIDYHDPYVNEVPRTREHSELAGRRSISLSPEVVRAYDAVLICTDHDSVDYGLLAAHSGLIVDTRNAMARVSEIRAKVVKA